MKKHYILLIVMLFLSVYAQHVSAQLSFDWFAQQDDISGCNRMQMDATGKVYALKNVGGVPGTLIKFNSNGGVAWSVNYALTSPSGDDKLVVDGAGNAYVAYYGTCDPNCNRVIGHLKKFNVNGVLVWDDTLAGRSGTYGTQLGLAIDASGNLLLGITIDIAVSPPAIPAVEIAKYSPNGNRQWKLSDIYPTWPYRGPLKGFSCDQFGNVYAARINAVTNRPHLLKCSGSGFFQYDKELASGNAVSYSQFDAVYDQASSSIFCVYEKNDGASDSIFMLRADPVNNGDVLWTQKKLNNGFFTSIQIDGFGNVYWELNDGGFQIQKYNATGTYQFSLPDGGGRLAFDNQDNVYVSHNAMVSKYSNAGTLLWDYSDGYSSLSTGAPVLFNAGDNKIYFAARNTNLEYGLVRYSVCSCTYIATSVITNTTGAVCNNGKIKINFTGSFSYYPHLELYDENDVLLTSVNKGQTSTSHTFSNLAAGNYTVKVFDKSCCEQDFTPQVKCPKPDAGLAATNITSTSARTNWTTLPCASGYRVQYRKQGTTAWTNKAVSSNTGFKALTGLMPATTYEWRVQTTCVIGTPAVYSAFSAIQTFTTLVMRNGVGVADDNLPAVEDLRVYPNPSENELHIMFESGEASARLKIVSSMGQIVFDSRVQAEDGNYTEQLDISKLKKGLYVLLVQTQQGSAQKTFVKQ